MGWVRPWRRQFATVFRRGLIVVGNVSFPLAVMFGVVGLIALESMVPPGVDPGRVGQPPLHGAAGERVQQAALQDHRRRHRAGGRFAPPRRSPSSATRSRSSRSTTRRGARTRSPRRAGSTRPRTTATTATAIFRLFYDTIKGGDFRSREANVYRLAQVSNEIIDQATAQGVPFAREYGGLLDNRSFGGAQVVAHVLRPRPDRPAAAARRLPGDDAPGRGGQGHAAHAHGDARRRRRRRRRARHRRPRPADRRGAVASPRTRSCSPPAATRTSFFLSHQREGVQRDRDLARAQARRGVREPVLHADPPDLHPAVRRDAVQADADERVAAQRRAHLGAAEGRRRPPAGPDPRGRARLLPRAPLPGVRQPRPARRRLARREGDDRRGPRRRAAPQRRLPRLRGRDRAPRRSRRSAPATGTCSRCTSGSRARTRTACRCASTPPRTTRWAACGSTTT